MRALIIPLTVLLLPLAIGGCELDEATVPSAKPQIVVHAVLNPTKLDQLVLVEQTLAGEVNVPDRAPSDTLEPILSGGGVPITDAVVEMLLMPDGAPDDCNTTAAFTALGIHDADDRLDGKGHGVYHFRNAPPPMFGTPHGEIPVIRGRRYGLKISWRGQVACSFTTVPSPDRLLPQALTPRVFNVDHDSVVFDWPNASATKRFALFAGTPYGPFILFSDSARLVVRGSVRNLFAERFPYVFQPGFRQTIATEAVDTNYFDYYRSVNNPFTGTGIINHVDGGIGVFGAIYPLDTLALDVVADFDEPYEGRYTGGFGGTDVLELYLGEDVGDGARRVSGRLTQGNVRHGIVGTTSGGGKLSLAVLRGWYANDGLYTMTAQVDGETLVTTDSRGETLTWHRTSPAVASR